MNRCLELGKAAELASVVVIVGTFWWLKKNCALCVCVFLLGAGSGVGTGRKDTGFGGRQTLSWTSASLLT